MVKGYDTGLAEKMKKRVCILKIKKEGGTDIIVYVLLEIVIELIKNLMCSRRKRKCFIL